MKFRYSLLFWLLVMPLPVLCQDPNPFVKKADAAKSERPPGDSYVAVVEHILVPPDLIGDWIRSHHISGDADELRALVEQWIGEGKATLEYTGICTGVSDRKAVYSSLVELIYPTENKPSGSEVWPLPTSFETRNTGFAVELHPTTYADGPRLSLWMDHVKYTGSRAWDVISGRTRQPGDVLMPEFRSARTSWGAWQDMTPDPFNGSGSPQVDPPVKPPASLPGGKYQLIARFDPLSNEREEGKTRLVFLRGDFTARAKPTEEVPDLSHLAYELVEIPHAAISAWQRSAVVGDIPAGAWEFVEGLRKGGGVTTISSGGGLEKGASGWTLENISEEIYPTEYQPIYEKTVLRRWQSPKSQKEGGQMVEGLATYETQRIESYSGLKGASLATSFETRNTGTTIQMTPLRDESGLLATLRCQHVVRLGDTVSRRIDNNGEWIPDCTMPLFASNHFNTTCRITPGAWTLVGTGSLFTGLGKSDTGRCLLFFIKLE